MQLDPIPINYPKQPCKHKRGCKNVAAYWHKWRTGKIQLAALGGKSQFSHTKEYTICEACVEELKALTPDQYKQLYGPKNAKT